MFVENANDWEILPVKACQYTGKRNINNIFWKEMHWCSEYNTDLSAYIKWSLKIYTEICEKSSEQILHFGGSTEPNSLFSSPHNKKTNSACSGSLFKGCFELLNFERNFFFSNCAKIKQRCKINIESYSFVELKIALKLLLQSYRYSS